MLHYDRRGRGDSGNTLPYAVEREIDDIQALIEAVGGSAAVFGMSSGGALALEAAKSNPAITKLALYEAPFIVDSTHEPLPDDFIGRRCAEPHRDVGTWRPSHGPPSRGTSDPGASGLLRIDDPDFGARCRPISSPADRVPAMSSGCLRRHNMRQAN